MQNIRVDLSRSNYIRVFSQKGKPRGKFVSAFANHFFDRGGVQINLNVVDLATLEDAMHHPDKEEYKGIVVKVTGYSAHFVFMDRQFQEEFIKRVNYQNI